MNARSLVFEVGDRVTGSGTVVVEVGAMLYESLTGHPPLVRGAAVHRLRFTRAVAEHDADGVWLDLAWSAFLHLDHNPNRLVRLIGADLAAVPTEFGPDTVPGRVTITGIWLGDAIEVQSQSPAPPEPPFRREWTTPPCPPPAGGWPRGKPDQRLDFDIGDLQETGAAVVVIPFRPSPEQGAVLVVAATDVDAVRTVLQPQLPDRLCVVPSRWTRAQLDDVMARLRSRGLEWAVDGWGVRVDEDGQPFIRVELFRVTADLADWADSLPDGLLKLIPALTPLPATRLTIFGR